MSKTLLSKVANALSFAHLAGLGRPAAEAPPEDEDKTKPAAAADDEDPKKKRDDETAEQYAARIEAMPEDEDKDEDKDDKAAAAAAAAPSDAALAAARAEGVAEGRQMERERGATVFASKAAASNLALAAELTFGSDLEASRVVGVLAKATPPASASRASRNPNVGPGAPGAENTTRQQVAGGWDRAFSKANPGRKR